MSIAATTVPPLQTEEVPPNKFAEWVNRHPVASGVIKTAVSGGLSFGGGMIVATIGNLSPLYAVVMAVSTVVSTAISYIVAKIGEKKGLEAHKITLINVAITAVVATATLVTLAALSILGPVGIGVMAGLAGFGVVFSLVRALVQYKALKTAEATAALEAENERQTLLGQQVEEQPEGQEGKEKSVLKEDNQLLKAVNTEAVVKEEIKTESEKKFDAEIRSEVRVEKDETEVKSEVKIEKDETEVKSEVRVEKDETEVKPEAKAVTVEKTEDAQEGDSDFEIVFGSEEEDLGAIINEQVAEKNAKDDDAVIPLENIVTDAALPSEIDEECLI